MAETKKLEHRIQGTKKQIRESKKETKKPEKAARKDGSSKKE